MKPVEEKVVLAFFSGHSDLVLEGRKDMQQHLLRPRFVGQDHQPPVNLRRRSLRLEGFCFLIRRWEALEALEERNFAWCAGHAAVSACI